MEKLQENFENSLLEVVDEYDRKGLSIVLSIIIQRILFDMEGNKKDTKKILH